MSELELMRRLRSEIPEPGDDELRAAEAKLITAIRDRSRPVPSRPVPSRPVHAARSRPWLRPAALWSGLTTGLAMAVAATVVVAGSGDVPHPPDAPIDPVVVPVSVTQLLDRAALAAEEAAELDPRPDQFIVYRSVTMDVAATLGDRETRHLYRTDRELWASADGKRDGTLRRKNLEPRPYPGWPIPASARRAAGTTELFPMPACENAAIPDTSRRDYAYLKTLPTDADGMLAALKRRAGEGSPTDLTVWRALGSLLTESYLPLAQRAAIFRAAKQIGGVAIVDDATDAADRTGVAVARVDEPRGVRTEIIFDPVTYRYLGESSYVVNADRASAPVGSQLSATAELSVTVADAAPKAPKAKTAPDSCR